MDENQGEHLPEAEPGEDSLREEIALPQRLGVHLQEFVPGAGARALLIAMTIVAALLGAVAYWH